MGGRAVGGRDGVSPLRGLAGADVLPERAEAVVDYRITAALDAAPEAGAGPRARHLAQSLDRRGPRPLVPSVPERVSEQRRARSSRESGGQLRGDDMPADGWGWIERHRAEDRRRDRTCCRRCSSSARRRQRRRPDGGARRRCRGRCSRARRSRSTSTFTAQLPKVFARTGYAGDYFLVGQWFPKLAVYEPAGVRGRATGGWNCHQFHANSEFYADFGHYRVAITVPTRFIVGATGERVGAARQRERHHDLRLRAGRRPRLRLDRVARFVEVTRRFDAAREVSAERVRAPPRARLGRPVDELRLRDVEVTAADAAGAPGRRLERYLRAAMLRSKSFGLSYGPYPHRTLTIVDPPDSAQPAPAGWSTRPSSPPAPARSSTARPFDRAQRARGGRRPRIRPPVFPGHGRVSNEFEEPWLDEGMTTYITGRAMEEMFGPDATLIDFAAARRRA